MSPERPKVGSHVYYHKDGSVYGRGTLREGVMTGYWEWYRKDGSLMRSGHFIAGKQAGEWTTFAKDGRVVKVTVMNPKSTLSRTTSAAKRRKREGAEVLRRVAAHQLHHGCTVLRRRMGQSQDTL